MRKLTSEIYRLCRYGASVLGLLCVVACSSEIMREEGMGTLSVHVSLDADMANVDSRAEQNEASVEIINDKGKTVYRNAMWRTDETIHLPVGNYQVRAVYGDVSAEGFVPNAFAGEANASVQLRETSAVDITCQSVKAGLKLDYTDDFKAYFGAAVLTLQTAANTSIDMKVDETRTAYFLPGTAHLLLSAKRGGTEQVVKLAVRSWEAKAKEMYHYTLDVDAATATLQIAYVDEAGRTEETVIGLDDVSIRAQVPTLRLRFPHQTADVWAHHATMQVEQANGVAAPINGETVVIQYKDGDEWKAFPRQSYSLEEGFRVDGLTPATTYIVRANYVTGDQPTGFPSQAVQFTTEKDMQLPNGGFEDWDIRVTSAGLFGTYKIYDYLPTKAGEEGVWATNNQRAQAYVVLPVEITTCPAVIYVNAGHRGRAVELHTAGHGGGYASTSWVMYPESAFAGSIFLGSYTWKDKQEQKQLGMAFTSRPKALSFWYKYRPHATDAFRVVVKVLHDRTVLGSADFVSRPQSTADADYQLCTLPIIYSNTGLKATQLSVEFFSTDKTEFSSADLVRNGKLTLTDVGEWSTHYGSFLCVDDVELQYE